MFFDGNEEDDGGGFSVGMPTLSGPNLSSLFGIDKQSYSGSNESLKYTAPKQPKPKGDENSKGDGDKTDAPSLLYACACHTYKYIDGQYQKQGKLGVALLGSVSSKDIQKSNYAQFYDDQQQNWSICFDNENQQLEFTKWVALAQYNIQSTAELITQDLNCIDVGQVIAKGDSLEMQYTGWLHAGNAFGKVFDSNKDSGKLFKFKVGKGKVIKGWDIGVVGMKKGSKRLLVIPPDQGYGSKSVGDKVPPNSTLIFQVEVTREIIMCIKGSVFDLQQIASQKVKFTNPEPDEESTPTKSGEEVNSDPKMDPEPSVATPQESGDSKSELDDRPEHIRSDSLKDRSRSISEQLSKTTESSTKSKILERMSKMGQSVMIPTTAINQTSTSTPDKQETTIEADRSQPVALERQSSNEKEVLKPESPKPALRPKPEAIPRHVPASSIIHDVHGMHNQYPHQYASSNLVNPQHQLALYQSSQATQAALLGLQTFQQQPVQQLNSASSTEMNLMMTDSRLKHTEMKSDISKLMEKIDSLNTKVQKLTDGEYGSRQQMLTQAPEMEAMVIMQNVSRIMKENEKLRTDCEEKTKKIEVLNERMSDLLTRNQQYFEKSNQLLATQNDSIQASTTQAMAKVALLEQQKIALETELESSKKESLLAKRKGESISKNDAELRSQIESLKAELKETKEAAENSGETSQEREAAIEDLKQKLKAEKREQKKLKMRLDEQEEELADIKLEKDNFIKNQNELKKKRKDDQVKFSEEMEELKSQHDSELLSLKQRLKKDHKENTQQTLMEDLRKDYEVKLKEKIRQKEKENEFAEAVLKSKIKELQDDIDHKLKQIEELGVQHAKQKTILEEENAKLRDEVSTLSQKANVGTSEAKGGFLATQVEQLRERNEKLQAENKKNEERLLEYRDKKNEVENIIEEKKNEVNKLKQEIEAAYDRGVNEGRSNVKTISNASYERGLQDGRREAESKSENNEKVDVVAEVKKVMNSVFMQLRNEFDAEEEYEGKDILATLLHVIKDTTLKLVQQKSSESDDEEESEVDEEENESQNQLAVEKKVNKDNEQSDMEVDGKMIEKKDSANPLREGGEQAPRGNVGSIDPSNDKQLEKRKVNENERKSTLHSSGLDPKLLSNGSEQSEKSKADTNANSTTEKKNISNKAESKSSKVFENDEEGGDFFKKPPKKPDPSALNRSPPPLFDDDDDDTNWII